MACKRSAVRSRYSPPKTHCTNIVWCVSFCILKTGVTRSKGQYYATALSQVNAEDDSLVGWYDHAGSPAGGWVRVITAVQKD